jgi:hypothetical protein
LAFVLRAFFKDSVDIIYRFLLCYVSRIDLDNSLTTCVVPESKRARDGFRRG